MAQEYNTLNNFISALQDIAARHRMINSFGIGEDSDIGTNELIYPCLWVNPTNAGMPKTDAGYSTFSVDFEIQVFDLINKDSSNKNEVYSDSLEVLKQVVKQFDNHPFFNDSNFIINGDANFEKLYEKYDEEVCGYKVTIPLMSPNNGSWCDLPIDEINGYPIPPANFTGSTYSPTVNANYYTTAATLNGYVVTFDRTDSLSAFTLDLSSLSGVPDTNTFVTGFTYDSINSLTISKNDGADYSVLMDSFSAATISGGTFYGDGSQLSGITIPEGYWTAGTGTNAVKTINTNSIASGDYSFIGGGAYNSATTVNSAVVGGKKNIASGALFGSFAGGGAYNKVGGTASSIIGGAFNETIGGVSMVLGSSYSTVASSFAAIIGSQQCSNSGNNSTIIGGNVNTIGTNSFYSSIVGGQNDYLQGTSSSIVGSYSSSITGNSNSIIGAGVSSINGSFSSIQATKGSDIKSGSYNSIILGGKNNQITGTTYSSIVGGYSSYINQSNSSIILGGKGSGIQSYSKYSSVIGGKSNVVNGYSTYSFIGGGLSNTINSYTALSTIIGGAYNIIGGSNSAVIGGIYNKLTGNNSIILGSDGITGTTDSTVYVPYLNVSLLSATTTATTFNDIVVANDGSVMTNQLFSIGLNFTVTGETWNYTAPEAFQINSYDNPSGLTVDIQVSGSSYTLGSVINQYTPLTVDVDNVGFINLKCEEV